MSMPMILMMAPLNLSIMVDLLTIEKHGNLLASGEIFMIPFVTQNTSYIFLVGR